MILFKLFENLYILFIMDVCIFLNLNLDKKEGIVYKKKLVRLFFYFLKIWCL